MNSAITVAVGGVAIVDDAILLIKRGTEPSIGLWSVPGGRVETGETLAEAIVREMAEETGLTAVAGPLIALVERISGPPSPNRQPSRRHHRTDNTDSR